ncbi:hypothetical protein F443_19154 [Phytophthora nicotianae P1569]|uniref:Uncharacterized protein n=1 Tax=Phytophthora nicotianae P1569 TaxID=1317065 RepID=V9E5N2_PHYNI|nr:hypothetical protein F443_19154 [Phytophthora nicotianae P1569]
MDLGPDPPPLDHEDIIRLLLERMTDWKLPRGCINDAAAHFGCTRQTVSSVFHARDKEPRESARGIARVWTPDAIQEALETVPAIERTSYIALAAATGIPRTTLARAKGNKDGIRRATGSVKSYLTSDQMRQRIEFALSFVGEGAAGTKSYYLTYNEKVQHFAVPNVKYLTKLGCCPFVEMVEAKRSSKNRPAGTPELKCTSIAKPPRRPDFNVLDLGFFSSIQAHQYRKRVYNVEQLVDAVESGFVELKSVTLSKSFLTLQSVLEQAMLDRGGNTYKIPHLGKDKWVRLGDLLLSLPCSSETVKIGKAALDDVVV